MRSWLPGLAAAAFVAAVLAVVHGHAGYDMQYALIWGRELAHGHAPSFSGPFAPTPHPLANLFGAILAPLGRSSAPDAFLLVVGLSLGAVMVAAWRIGRRCFGTAAGVLAAIVVVSRPSLVSSALRGSIDVPALALTLFALDALLAERRRWVLALVLLLVAGLLRPETWLLSLAVAAWWWRENPQADHARRTRIVLLAVTAPLLWAGVDLVLTGDPTFSLTGTQALADELSRPRSATLAPLVMPPLLSVVLGLGVLLAGIVGLVAMSREPSPRFAVLVGVLALSVVGFVIIGIEGLPLLARYLFPAAAVLAILGAATAAGATNAAGARWSSAQVLAAVALLAAVPATVTGVRDAITDSRERRTVDAELARFVRSASFASARRTCGPLSAATYRIVPTLAYALDVTPATISPDVPRGLLVLPRSGRAAASLIGPGDPAPPILAPPRGFRLQSRVHTRDWAIACRVTP